MKTIVVEDKGDESYLEIIARIRQQGSARPKSLAQRFGTKKAEQIKQLNRRITGERD